MRPPMPYSGGKQRVADAIANLLPPERTSRQERDRRKSAELKTLREENRLLAAKVERVRALALNQSGPGRWARDEGWAAFVPAADLLRALDEEPQP